MFERYTDQCKRAIFFARQTALRLGATAIDSGHLLLGLLTEKETCADTVFRLQALLPEEAEQQAFEIKQPMMKGTIPLSNDGKRAIAYTAFEANRLRDYWIDTEHLVLGILREESSSAAAKLRAIGLELESCRQQIVYSKNSRPQKEDLVLLWVRRCPITFTWVVVLLFEFGVATALILLGFAAIGMAFALLATIYFFWAMAREGCAK
jgi:ATP-dependent Clp protease ATP-binding subunit ClpC